MYEFFSYLHEISDFISLQVHSHHLIQYKKLIQKKTSQPYQADQTNVLPTTDEIIPTGYPEWFLPFSTSFLGDKVGVSELELLNSSFHL